MKVGDLVKHKICGIGVIIKIDPPPGAEILVFYPTRNGRKKMRTRRGYLEPIR